MLIVSNYTNRRHRRSLWCGPWFSDTTSDACGVAMKIELPYGRTPLQFDAGDRHIEVIRPLALPDPAPIEALVDAALDAPIDRPALKASAGARVTVIVSDATRVEPRAVFLDALRRRLDGVHWTIAIATGTHGPASIRSLGLPESMLRNVTIVNHDGHSEDNLVTLGTTAYGTPMRVHRCVVDADLVIATGCIRPHYFAGFGAGAKAIFPGLGHATAIRFNHRLKTTPGARSGIVDGNPCREDLEAAVRMVATPIFLVNGVCGPDDRIHAVVAGDWASAFRTGANLARPWFTVHARPAKLVIASDSLPVTATLYQASKIAAAAAPFVEPGGTLAIAAECPEGVGPLDVVNEAILRIGILPRLPAGARLVLISGLAPEIVSQTLVEYAPSIESLFESTNRNLVLPQASQLLCEARS